MDIIKEIIARAQANKQRIVLPEGTEERTLKAANRILTDEVADLIILGDPAEIEEAAKKWGLGNIHKATIINPAASPKKEEYAQLLFELRKKKGMTLEEARQKVLDPLFFGCLMIKAGDADGQLAGARNTTGNVLRPALQIIKTKPGNRIVSSCFILVRPAASGANEVLAMGDCAINIAPSEDDLVEIGIETAKCATIFGIDPKVAYLSYSSFGSGAGPTVDMMSNAAKRAAELAPEFDIEGELQFDAAVSPNTAKIKCPGSKVAGHANTFIFPDINAGNIGYKIAQRLGQFDAYGPILLGLNAPINDLSRGCNAIEIYSMAIITAALA